MTARAEELRPLPPATSLVNPAELAFAPELQPAVQPTLEPVLSSPSPLLATPAPLTGTDAGSPLIADEAVTPAAFYGSSASDGRSRGPAQFPINWISGPYIRSGVTLGLGSSLFDSQDAGWTVSGGFRNALPPNMDERLFLDLGGSYMSAYGETSRVFDGNRTVRNTITMVDNPPEFIPNAFNVHLREVKRAGIHLGFGWYWGEALDAPSNDPQLRLSTRLGGRLSHVRGRFYNELIDDGPPVGPNEQIQKVVPVVYGRTDTSGGLYVGTEAILLDRKHSWGNTAWTLDGEFANDWIEFDGFDSGSLGTASITLGWMFSR